VKLFSLVFISIGFLIFSSCGESVTGEAGVDGMSVLVTVVDEPAGDNCTNGGSKVSFGYDTNENGILDATEVTTSTFICNGEDGQDGSDGSANVDVQILQWSSNNTQFYQNDSPNSGDGDVYFVATNSSLTQDVLQNGFVKVEVASDITGPWFQLPYMFYENTTGDVGYVYDAWYSYGEGAVRIDWNCSFGRTLSEWEEISQLYEGYYKITTIVE
tara:strand:- start:218 stop:862 length:645 start_codon:yes stop_codon:yes gene_type:complete